MHQFISTYHWIFNQSLMNEDDKGPEGESNNGVRLRTTQKNQKNKSVKIRNSLWNCLIDEEIESDYAVY